MSSPVAVLISDVHYSLQNLSTADAAVRMALRQAKGLGVPLVIAGDLHDTKANIRGECADAMMNTFETNIVDVFKLRGNHDSLNEKSMIDATRFLDRSYYDFIDRTHSVRVISNPEFTNDICVIGKPVHLVPYHHDLEELRAYLRKIDIGSCVVMHQGLEDTDSGEYYQDKTAVCPKDVAGLIVVSGHYHARQAIELPDGGMWYFLGSPFTHTFSEADDPEKGISVLYSDGHMDFVPLNLRWHRIVEMNHENYGKVSVKPDDILWVKYRGPRAALTFVNKEQIAKDNNISQDFKLDLIPTDDPVLVKAADSKPSELLDSIIDSNEDEDRATRLKEKWRDLCDYSE